MDDSLVYTMLLKVYEQIRDQQRVADESILVAHALHRAMRQVSPDFDSIYAAHYSGLLEGPIGQGNAAKIAELDELIVELEKLARQRFA